MPDGMNEMVAIVTGSSRGIGKAIAKAYASAGAKVVVTARTEKEQEGQALGSIHKTVDEIRQSGGEAVAIRADVTREEEVNALVEKTLEAYGRIDVLVNNVGTTIPGAVMQTFPQRMEALWRVNFLSAFLCTYAVLPRMVERRSGSIVFLTSSAARSLRPNNAVYGAAKAAVERFAFVLAEEVREHRIAVNLLDPGLILTETAALWNSGRQSNPGDPPEAVGLAALYLAQQTAQTWTGRLSLRAEYGVTWPLGANAGPAESVRGS